MSSSVSSLIDVLLTAIRYAARDTNFYEFARPDGAVLPAAEPGAHIDLHLANGMVRQYSLTRPDPAPTQYILGIKRDAASRGGCPDDLTRNGRRCGANSAYSRPGGASPKCYPSDVTTAEIEEYRSRATR